LLLLAIPAMDMSGLPILELSLCELLSRPSFEFVSACDGETLTPSFGVDEGALVVPGLREGKVFGCNADRGDESAPAMLPGKIFRVPGQD
jgi:hypothetical protein